MLFKEPKKKKKKAGGVDGAEMRQKDEQRRSKECPNSQIKIKWEKIKEKQNRLASCNKRYRCTSTSTKTKGMEQFVQWLDLITNFWEEKHKLQ